MANIEHVMQLLANLPQNVIFLRAITATRWLGLTMCRQIDVPCVRITKEMNFTTRAASSCPAYSFSADENKYIVRSPS
jgi:hypothetical protein